MTDITYTTGDQVSWFEDDTEIKGVVQERSTQSVAYGGETLSGSSDNAALVVLTDGKRHVLKREADVRRIIIPM